MKVDKLIGTVQGMMYEIEVFKMNAQGYALKKDLEILEVKSQSFCPTTKVTELQTLCKTFAPSAELSKTNDLVKLIHEQLSDFSLQKAVDSEFRDLKNLLTQEIRTKVNKNTFKEQITKFE